MSEENKLESPNKPTLKGRHGNRVQFIAIMDEIDGFLEEGYSWKSIYEYFTEKKVLMMKYNTFCKYMNGEVNLSTKQRKVPKNTRRIHNEKSEPNREKDKPSKVSVPVKPIQIMTTENKKKESFDPKKTISNGELFGE